MDGIGPTWDLVAQLTDGKFGVPADVTFLFEDENEFEVIGEVEAEEVNCHKVILALVSKKFREMCYGTSTNMSKTIRIKDVSRKVFTRMISYIYGSKTDFEKLSLPELLELVNAAEEYEVVGLTDALIEMIDNFPVNEENLLETLNMSAEFEKFPDIAGKLFIHCANYIKSNIKDHTEIEGFIDQLDLSKNAREELIAVLTSLTPPPCSNCSQSPCLDSSTIPNTEKVVVGSTVAVINNNCPGYWGTATKAQHGQVTKLVAHQTVRVLWCDGSESDYNVYLTDRKQDPQLVYHCLH